MDSSNAVDDKQPAKRQRMSGTNDNGGGGGPIPIRRIYIGNIKRDVSEQNILKTLMRHHLQLDKTNKTLNAFTDDQ